MMLGTTTTKTKTTPETVDAKASTSTTTSAEAPAAITTAVAAVEAAAERTHRQHLGRAPFNAILERIDAMRVAVRTFVSRLRHAPAADPPAQPLELQQMPQQSQQTQPQHLTEVPKELVHLKLSKMDLTDVLRLSRTCSDLRNRTKAFFENSVLGPAYMSREFERDPVGTLVTIASLPPQGTVRPVLMNAFRQGPLARITDRGVMDEAVLEAYCRVMSSARNSARTAATAGGPSMRERSNAFMSMADGLGLGLPLQGILDTMHDVTGRRDEEAISAYAQSLLHPDRSPSIRHAAIKDSGGLNTAIQRVVVMDDPVNVVTVVSLIRDILATEPDAELVERVRTSVDRALRVAMQESPDAARLTRRLLDARAIDPESVVQHIAEMAQQTLVGDRPNDDLRDFMQPVMRDRPRSSAAITVNAIMDSLVQRYPDVDPVAARSLLRRCAGPMHQLLRNPFTRSAR